MTPCPQCFRDLLEDRIAYRCTTGSCAPAYDPNASLIRGYSVSLTPVAVTQRADEKSPLPSVVQCMNCNGGCNQEICMHCGYDIPVGWRGLNVFTLGVTGARGSGKSVFIGVLIEVLRRYTQRSGRTLSPFTRGTKAQYEIEYYGPIFGENRALQGTAQLEKGGQAYQRDPMIWQISASKTNPAVTLVFRDMAGEDIEASTHMTPGFTYHNYADLVIFLFDPTVLNNVTQILHGIIPDVDKGRLGRAATEVLPNLLAQLSSPSTALALTVAKFDALQHLPKADNHYAAIMANPSARFNRDDTMRREFGSGKVERQVKKEFLDDTEFLDAEVRSLLALLSEPGVTIQAEQGLNSGKLAEVRHFAVSAIGDTPPHSMELTKHGISPFRVLDPLLWGLVRKGFWI